MKQQPAMQTQPKTTPLDEARAAQARSLAYDLFARLLLKGPSSELMASMEAIPELLQALARTDDSGEVDYERAAAEHFHLFGFNVFPYQSMFLDTDGRLGGPQSEQALSYYRQAGFNLSPRTPAGRFAAGESPDHAGLELAFLSFLSGAEADALQDGERLHVLRIRDLQRGFLDLHLLPWLPALVQAIGQQGSPFYTTLAGLSLELVFEHRAALGDGLPVGRPAFALPHPPALLEDEKTGLKDIAAYLLTPAYSGLYLSREDIARLGRGRNLPRGFGARLQMLSNLLRSAVAYDLLPNLLEDISSLVGEWQAAYRSHLETGTPWAPFAAAWLDRLQATKEVVARITLHAERGEEQL